MCHKNCSSKMIIIGGLRGFREFEDHICNLQVVEIIKRRGLVLEVLGLVLLASLRHNPFQALLYLAVKSYKKLFR